MDLLQFEHFLAVVEERTFTRAAQKVCRTQPAVSQSIRRLEEEIGLPLFVRDVHEVTLTEAGRRLVEYAERMLRLREEAMHAFRDLRNPNTGTVSIAAHESAALYLLPPVLKRFCRRFPDVKVTVYRERPNEIARGVLDREIDLGFVRERPTFTDLQVVQIYADSLVLVASPRHRFARRSSLRIEELGDEQFVSHQPCEMMREKVLPLFEREDTPLKIVAELASFSSIKEFVQDNMGVAIVPRIVVLKELESGVLVEIPVAGFDVPRYNYMVFRNRRYVSEPARALIDLLTNFNWQQLGALGADDVAALPRKLIPIERRSAS